MGTSEEEKQKEQRAPSHGQNCCPRAPTQKSQDLAGTRLQQQGRLWATMCRTDKELALVEISAQVVSK